MGYENFTTFTEVEDAGNYWAETASRVTTTNLPNKDGSYVYKDYGVDYFTNYEHWFDFNITSVTGNFPEVVLWGISNQVDSYEGWSVGQYIRFKASSGANKLHLRDVGTSNYEEEGTLSLSTTYYAIVKRTGTTLTLEVYSTPELRELGGTGDVVSCSIICQSAALRYLYGGTGEDGTPSGSDYLSHYTENLDINLPPIQKTINSDAQVRGIKSINSDSIIKQVNLQEAIDSDATIVIRKSINSDTTIKGIVQETIDSDSKVVNRIQEVINSDAIIKHIIQENIDSDSKVVLRYQEVINSDSYIQYHKDFYCKQRLQKDLQKDFNLQLRVNQPAPTDPTGLICTDLKTGEALLLDWTGTNYGWNIYKDIGGIWTKQNLTLVTSTDYVIGGLTTGVTYSLKVKGVNGIGVESTGVIITGTPTFDLSHYTTKPIWEILIDGSPLADSVLERIELVYGPSFSQASFYLPKNPLIPGFPGAEKQIVVISVNGKKLFTGYLTKRTDIINSTNLQINYIAVSKLWDYTWDTIRKNYNEPKGDHLESISVKSILIASGCPYNEIDDKDIYGEVTVSDYTKLDLMTNLLSQLGNYKIYCSPNGDVSYYKIGSPVNIRTFEIGKHIIDYEKSIDVTDKIDQVEVFSDYSQRMSVQSYHWSGKLWFEDRIGDRSNLIGWVNVDEDGNLYIRKVIYAKNISNIQVYGLVNDKPVVTEYLNLSVVPGHVGLNMWPNGGTEGKNVVYKYKTFKPTWKTISAKVDYGHYGNWAVITISPIPIEYKTNLQKYIATFKTQVGGSIVDMCEDVHIMFDPIEYLANVRIFYTYQRDKLSTSSGGGSIKRTYHDSVYPISTLVMDNSIVMTDENTNAEIQQYLDDKVLVEYNKLSKSTDGGRITILGDETIDLRSQVNGMEVIKVTHDFTNGFYTYLDLTNEQFYYGDAALKQKEKRNTRDKLQKTDKRTHTIKYNLLQSKNLVGESNNEPTTTNNPESGIGVYSD